MFLNILSWASSRLIPLTFLGLFALYGYFAQDIYLDFWAEEEAFNARTFPHIVAAGGLIISSLALLVGTRVERSLAELKQLRWFQAALLVACMLVFAQLLTLAGFLPTTVIFLGVAAIILGERRWQYLALGSIPLAVLFYLLMGFLDIYLEPGVWAEWFSD